jgi:hypothetical protein
MALMALALVRDFPEAVSSCKATKFLSSKVFVPPASQKDAGYGLSSFSTLAHGIWDAWYPPAEEEVSAP